jgi:hypothetical protein
MLLVVDHPRREPLLEQMALPAVSAVEPLGVEADQPVHRCRELGLPALDDDVEMRAEQAPRVEPQPEELHGLLQQERERRAVGVVEEDEASASAARRDVVVAVREVRSWSPWHASADGNGGRAAAPAVGTLSSQGLSLGHVR